MVQDSVSPVSFFDVSPKSRSQSASQTKDDAVSSADGESFSAVLNRTGNPSARNSAPRPKFDSPKTDSLDKPKLGNREPFFPRKSMPFHPDDVSTANSPVGMQSSMALRGSMPVVTDIDGGSHGLEAEEVWDTTGHAAPQVDDRTGVMGQSYEGTAVSYPVSRIARDGLDEKAQDDLEKQGLWNLPTMVMAQPTPRTMLMKDMVAQGMKGNAVPVQKPIAQFMASLENELGVTPDRLVQAFQNLPPGQLQLPPEQTMTQIVKQLGLTGDDQAKATELYSKMLAQMQMLDGNEKLKAAPLMAGGLTGAKIEQQLEKQVDLTQAKGQNENGRADQNAVFMKNPQGNRNGTLSPHALKEGKEAVIPMDVSQSGDKLVKNTDAKGDWKSLSYESMKGQDSNSNARQNQSQSQPFLSQGQNHVTGSQEQAPVKDQVKFDLKHDVSAEKVTKGGGPSLMDQTSLRAQQAGDLKPQVAQAAPVGIATGELKAAESNTKHEAIQSIINNAQMLASKGGGEMHMTLKPDHLGEIQLRVAMEGNHVNVQMVTERGEVKKLIEQSVHELRHGLAQHDLSMNKLDVSVGDRSAGNFKQGMPDFSAAREFANQFHQQNGRREMLNDLSTLRSTSGRSGLPGGLEAKSSAARQAPGRLNVVA